MRQFAERSGELLAFDVRGDGPVTVVAVHGVAGASDLWDEVVSGCPGLRFVLPDLRGFGRTPAGREPCTFDALVDDLEAVCEAAGAERPVAVGFSFGGWLAARWAELHPERLAGLVCVGSPLYADPALNAPFEEVIRRVTADDAVAPDLVEPFLGLWFGEAYRARRPDVVHWTARAVRAMSPRAVSR